MLFNSVEFLIIFLPLVVSFFYIIVYLKAYSVLSFYLIVCSLFFYGWWNPKYIILIITSIGVNYLIYKIMNKSVHYSKFYLFCGIIFNLLLLGFFKYIMFITDIIEDLTNYKFHIFEIILPLGISFFTFQQIAFLVDMYSKKKKCVKLEKYSLFVLFFPQLIAGPIVNFFDVSKQFNLLGKKQSEIWRNLSYGFIFILIGLIKKIYIVEKLSYWSDKSFYLNSLDGNLTFLDSWTGLISFSLQIYFDFSAYSDIAIGLGMLFGIHLPFNFNSPYKSTSIIDFWRNWHITLSNFLKNYLYIPLGGNRASNLNKYKNIFIVMLIGGLWHGANWNFILWGGLHGIYLIINHIWRSLKQKENKKNNLTIFLQRIWVFILVSLAWVFFRTETFHDAINFYKSIFCFNGIILPQHYHGYIYDYDVILDFFNIKFGTIYAYEGFTQLIWLLLFFIFIISSPSLKEIIIEKKFNNFTIFKYFFTHSLFSGIVAGLLFLLSIIKLIIGNQGEFIYFQF